MGEMRRCVKEWIRLSGKEAEHVSLSQDTAHEDLRQRRELRANSSVFVDQAAVRAAIYGRILVLEGVDRVERNILPLLNNLLENREITLEDGRLLLPPHRAHSLMKTNSAHQGNVVHVHPDFRVIGLMKTNGRKASTLDPPLRSRFQARYFPSLSVGSLLQLSREEAPQLSSSSPIVMKNYVKVVDALASAEGGSYRTCLSLGY